MIRTADGETHQSRHIGDIAKDELINGTVTVNLPPTYGSQPENKDLTVREIKPYAAKDIGVKEHIYTGEEDNNNKTHTFRASNISIIWS